MKKAINGVNSGGTWSDLLKGDVNFKKNNPRAQKRRV